MRVLRVIALGLTALSSFVLAQDAEAVPQTDAAKEKFSYQVWRTLLLGHAGSNLAYRVMLPAFAKSSSTVYTRIGATVDFSLHRMV